MISLASDWQLRERQRRSRIDHAVRESEIAGLKLRYLKRIARKNNPRPASGGFPYFRGDR